MKKTLLAVLAALLLPMLAATPAHAGRCDAFNYKPFRGENADYTYKAYGIVSRNVSCRRTVKHIRAYHRSSNEDVQRDCFENVSCRFSGYRCTYRAAGRGSSHRCKRGSKILRWKYRYVSGA